MNDCEGAEQQHQLARIPLEPDRSRTAVEFPGQHYNIHILVLVIPFQKLLLDLSLLFFFVWIK